MENLFLFPMFSFLWARVNFYCCLQNTDFSLIIKKKKKGKRKKNLQLKKILLAVFLFALTWGADSSFPYPKVID